MLVSDRCPCHPCVDLAGLTSSVPLSSSPSMSILVLEATLSSAVDLRLPMVASRELQVPSRGEDRLVVFRRDWLLTRWRVYEKRGAIYERICISSIGAGDQKFWHP